MYLTQISPIRYKRARLFLFKSNVSHWIQIILLLTPILKNNFSLCAGQFIYISNPAGQFFFLSIEKFSKSKKKNVAKKIFFSSKSFETSQKIDLKSKLEGGVASKLSKVSDPIILILRLNVAMPIRMFTMYALLSSVYLFQQVCLEKLRAQPSRPTCR